MLSADVDEIIDAMPRSPIIATRSPAARCSVGEPKCFRSSASSAAISPARRGRNTRESERWPANRLPPDLRESERLDPPLFSPATKAESGHDENITIARVVEDARARRRRGARAVEPTRVRARARHRGRARHHHRGHQIRVWPRSRGRDHLIDEVLTPDSSRFWPADQYRAGSFAAKLRQTAAARLSRRRATRRPMERRRAAAAASGGSRPSDERALP